MVEFDIPQELRILADGVPEDETVLLPAIKPSQWWDATVEADFEPVKIAKLLQFIADMME